MSSADTLLRAMIRPRFLVSMWPWRAVVYATTAAVVSGLVWLVLTCLLGPLVLAVAVLMNKGIDTGWYALAATALALLGVSLLALAGPWLGLAVAAVERRRLRLADDEPVVSQRNNGVYTDPAAWRAVAYLLLLAVIAPLWLGVLGVAGLVVVSTPIAVHHQLAAAAPVGGVVWRAALGVLLLPAMPYLTGIFSGAHARLARLLLCAEPDPAAAELIEVARSRTRLADAFDAERHRIERDLHDIAQQRLVSLTMQLSLAKLDLAADSPAKASVALAHEHAKALMVELRDLIQGISPRTLRELGLRAAIEELAAGSPLEVEVDADLDRFPPGVETVAFAVVSEALANAVKHAAAGEAAVTVRRSDGILTVQVRDDGGGGADPSGGTGLTGLADRTAAAGGRLLISSPVGGPTIVRVELPCAS